MCCFQNPTAASLLKSETDRQEFEALMRGKNCAKIGNVTQDEKLLIYGLNQKIVVEASLAKLRHSWKKTFCGEF